MVVDHGGHAGDAIVWLTTSGKPVNVSSEHRNNKCTFYDTRACEKGKRPHQCSFLHQHSTCTYAGATVALLANYLIPESPLRPTKLLRKAVGILGKLKGVALVLCIEPPLN